MKTEMVRSYSSLSVSSMAKSAGSMDQSFDDSTTPDFLSKICTPKNVSLTNIWKKNQTQMINSNRNRYSSTVDRVLPKSLQKSISLCITLVS